MRGLLRILWSKFPTHASEQGMKPLFRQHDTRLKTNRKDFRRSRTRSLVETQKTSLLLSLRLGEDQQKGIEQTQSKCKEEDAAVGM